jgi:hypothetical protein
MRQSLGSFFPFRAARYRAAPAVVRRANGAPFVCVLVGAVVGLSACNRRVFERVEPTCDPTISSDVDIPTQKAADILVVVDNSNSMREEQENLARNFVNPNVGTNAPVECPIDPARLSDFARCKDDDPPALCAFVNPSASQLQPGGELAGCGFIQILAAYENDFRVGVITTDVGVCDNRTPTVLGGLHCKAVPTPEECTVADTCDPAGQLCVGSGAPCITDDDCGLTWGFRPQRGCLQPNGPPGTEFKIIARSDLDDRETSNDNIGLRFTRTLNNVSINGTGFERGLDAMRTFLDESNVATRDPSCQGDLAAFLRDDAKLVVIFLSDEQDCSRTQDNDVLPAEFDGDQCSVVPIKSNLNGRACYERVSELTPVAAYADFLRERKANPDDVSVAVIAGGVRDADQTVTGGCRISDDGDPVAECYESRGQSNSPSVCGDAPTDPVARGPEGRRCLDESGNPKPCELPCCQADGGSRYFELADEFPRQSVKDSICYDSFRETMIKIAVKIGDVESVQIAEAPADDALIFVEKAPRESKDFGLVPRIAAEACTTEDGWYLDKANPLDIRVRFCGDSRPGPGERVRVRAKGAGADPEGGADACRNRGE